MSAIEELAQLFEYVFQRSDVSFEKPTEYDLAFVHDIIKSEIKPILPNFGVKDVKWFYDRKGKVHFIDIKPKKEVWSCLTTYYVDEQYRTYFNNLKEKGYKVVIYPKSYFRQLGIEIKEIKNELYKKGIEIDVSSAFGIEENNETTEV
ncbi:MAG: hypothetical protein NZ942_01705, partial [Candidatus Aenigmarchaeota archaeon]|nr:hypothetical protein [Candidatus Aenigmarchaeota archaeon]